MKLFIAVLAAAGTSCGTPKEFVRQETTTTFNDTAFLAAEAAALCDKGHPEHNDDNRKQLVDKLKLVCQRLDELAKKADGSGFDCDTWKPRDTGKGSGSDSTKSKGSAQ